MVKKTGMLTPITFREKVHIKGVLCYTVFKNGVPIETVRDENLILDGARNQMARLIAGDFADRKIVRIGVGTNGTIPEVTDTTLTNAFVKDLDGYSFPSMGQVEFDWSLSINEANGKSILEFGLIMADGVLYSRRIRDSGKPINKEDDISIIGKWFIIF